MYTAGQYRFAKAFQTAYSLSSAIGYSTLRSFAASRTFSTSRSNGNSGVWTPTTTKPWSAYFPAQART
jgi:hypothetical protein